MTHCRNREKISVKCFSLMLAVTLLSSFVLSACQNNNQMEQDETQNRSSLRYESREEYYGGLSALEYSKRMREVFVTLLSQSQRDKELGIGTMSYCYGFSQEDTPSEDLDTIITKGGGIYFELCTSVPAFYGLLKETETFLLQNGSLVEQNGKKIIPAREVDTMAHILFRTDVPVYHQSTSGATYDEDQQIYLYDELVNPLQEYYDRGWELLFLGMDADQAEYDFTYATEVFWYDPNGTLYDFYGEPVIENGDREILAGSDYVYYLIETGVWHYGDNYTTNIKITYRYDVEQIEQNSYTLDTPVEVSIGSSYVLVPEVEEAAMTPPQTNEE